jgi:hypothetical protein
MGAVPRLWRSSNSFNRCEGDIFSQFFSGLIKHTRTMVRKLNIRSLITFVVISSLVSWLLYAIFIYERPDAKKTELIGTRSVSHIWSENGSKKIAVLFHGVKSDWAFKHAKKMVENIPDNYVVNTFKTDDLRASNNSLGIEIEQKRYHFILIHFEHGTNLDDKLIDLGKRLKMSYNPTIVTTFLHARESMFPTTNSLSVVRQITSLSDHIVLHTEIGAESLKITHAIAPNKISIIHWGTDNVSFATDQNSNADVLHVVSYLCHDRNFEQTTIFLGSLAKIISNQLSIRISIAICHDAEPIWKAKLDKLFKDLDLIRHITFTSLDNVMLRSAIFVYIGRNGFEIPDELLHTIILKGILAIAFDEGYASEMLFIPGNRAGLVYRSADATAFAAKLSRMLSLPIEQQNAVTVRERMTSRFGTWTDVSKQYIALLEGGKELRSGERSLACHPDSSYILPSAREGVVNYGFFGLFDDTRAYMKGFDRATYNLVTDCILQVNANSAQDYFQAAGIMWYDGLGNFHKLKLDSDDDHFTLDDHTLKYAAIGWQKNVHEIFVSKSGTTTEGTRISLTKVIQSEQELSILFSIYNIGLERYHIDVAVHKVGEMKWIDLMVSVSNSFVTAEGVLGHVSLNH